MKKIALILLASSLLISCTNEQETTTQTSSQSSNYPFDEIRKVGEEIKADTAFSNHMEDISLPLSKSMRTLKASDPEFYEECMNCSSDEEMTEKLKSSPTFRKIARKKGLDLEKVSLIQRLK